MLMSRLLGERYKEKPADATMVSHIFLLRGGYMRQVANGIYSLLPPAKRVVSKIENIIRQEMDAIDGQEVLMPVVLPAELWKESGRWESVGSELMRMGQPGVPTIGAFLAEQLPEGGVLGFDGRTVSNGFAGTLRDALKDKNIRFAGDKDLVDAVWPDRPALSDRPVWELTGCGLTREEKLSKLREKMTPA